MDKLFQDDVNKARMLLNHFFLSPSSALLLYTECFAMPAMGPVTSRALHP